MKKWILFILLMAATGHAANWQQHKAKTLQFQKTLPGWCSSEKAEKMMDLIYNTHPTLCIEIGVFGGSSLYPCARALSFLGKGVICAIDPWSSGECTKGYTADNPNYQWWSKVDLNKIHQNFTQMLHQQGLLRFCNVLRMTSQEAAGLFQDETVDILHIDGNHSEESALTDATLFLPKVKKGGYIWFDDVNWSTTNKAVQYLSERCILDSNYSLADCFLFQKRD